MVQKLSYGHSLLQCKYSLHAVHWMVGLAVPKFFELKSVLGTANPPVDVPGWGGTSCVDFFLFFFPLLVLEPVLWASGSSLM